MRLEDQLCLLQQAKRLKELGVRQDNALYWYNCNDFGINILHKSTHGYACIAWPEYPENINPVRENYACFTVAELNAMLGYISNGIEYDYDQRMWVTNWDGKFIERFTTEAQASAELLIHSIKQTKELTVEEVNNRLNN